MLNWQKFKRVLSIAVTAALMISAMSVMGTSALAEETVSDNYDFAPFFTPSTFVLFNQDGGKADKWGELADKHIWWSWSAGCTDSYAPNVTLDSDVQYNGKNSVKFKNSGTVNCTHMDAYFKLKPSHTYTLSVYVLTEGPLGGQDMSSGIYVNYSLFKSSILDTQLYDSTAITAATLVKDAPLKNQAGKTIFQDFEEWEQLKVTFTTPADTGAGMIGMYMWNNTGRAYFSNLQLKDGDVAWDNAATTTTSQSTTTTDNQSAVTTQTDSTVPGTVTTSAQTSSNDSSKSPNTSDAIPYPIIFVGLLSAAAISGACILRKKKCIQ